MSQSDGDEAERIPLHEGGGINSQAKMGSRWPMLLVGAVAGFATALVVGSFMGGRAARFEA